MHIINNTKGQGTVEAAVVIPVLFALVLMMLQPGIVFYDYLIMRAAAAEGARLMATSSAEDGMRSCEDFIRNRLSAVPQQDLFHIHGAACSWDIQIQGDETAEAVEIGITNELRPLPLLDMSLRLLGFTNAAGNIELTVTHAEINQPSWLAQSEMKSPREWVEQW